MTESTPEYQWAVIRPDGLVVVCDEDEARSYAAAGNGGDRGYRLVRRPVAPWQEAS